MKKTTNSYKKTFEDYSTEYLLGRRALGSEIDDEAHEAIEETLVERAVDIPPRPHSPILPGSTANRLGRPVHQRLSFWASLVLALFLMGIGKAIAHTWIAYLYTACFIAYYLFIYFRRGTLSEEELDAEERQKIADEEGLTELMLAATDGNLLRLTDLVNYGAGVNERSLSGFTALMYAARNGHKDVVEFLLASGADKEVTSDKGSTARSIAERFGHHEISQLL